MLQSKTDQNNQFSFITQISDIKSHLYWNLNSYLLRGLWKPSNLVFKHFPWVSFLFQGESAALANEETIFPKVTFASTRGHARF